mmetsp:Transcript_136748/g.437432  ORF Transcript_136748/g.437432 Transcript_136748/m.437432 type:complete len:307 (+) Transcript_136748:1089-2009(+)
MLNSFEHRKACLSPTVADPIQSLGLTGEVCVSIGQGCHLLALLDQQLQDSPLQAADMRLQSRLITFQVEERLVFLVQARTHVLQLGLHDGHLLRQAVCRIPQKRLLFLSPLAIRVEPRLDNVHALFERGQSDFKHGASIRDRGIGRLQVVQRALPRLASGEPAPQPVHVRQGLGQQAAELALELALGLLEALLDALKAIANGVLGLALLDKLKQRLLQLDDAPAVVEVLRKQLGQGRVQLVNLVRERGVPGLQRCVVAGKNILSAPQAGIGPVNLTHGTSTVLVAHVLFASRQSLEHLVELAEKFG